jgi:hypothetical protein
MTHFDLRSKSTRERTAPRVAALAWRFVAIAALAPACHSSQTTETPRANLAGSRSAQEIFRPLKQRFVGSSPEKRAAIEPNLTWFVDAYPKDGYAPLARIYLAFIAVDKGDAPRARRLVEEAHTGASGTARDLAELVEGKILLSSGEPQQAFERFLPLVGKLIDPYARLLLDESIVAAAIGAHRWYEAVACMDLWLRDGQEDQADIVRAGVRRSLEAIPGEALETMLKAMQGQNGRSGYGTEIRKAVVARLATVALADQNTELARRLVDTTDEQALGDAAEGLEELASSGGAPMIDGRTIGLLVSTGKSLLGVRAAQVLTGVVDALRQTAGGPPDRVRLATRDERETKRTDLALLSLASHGAAILIAGFDPPQADVAARFAARTHIPVILLSPLSDGKAPAPPAFLLGASRASVIDALMEHVKAKGARAVAPVGGSLLGATTRGLLLLDEGACDAAGQAGESHFPIESWQKGKLDALLLLGDTACSSEAIGDVAEAKLGRVRAAIGLDGAEIAAEPGALALSVASAGRFPLLPGSSSSPLFGFKERHGQAPSWFATVGHDAAVLARAALRALPADQTEDAVEVAKRQQRAEASLRSVDVDLWSTSARGFSGAAVLGREIRVVEVK